VEAAIARELAEALPLGRLVEYESGGHHMQKTRAHDLAAEITSFLTEPAPDRRGRSGGIAT